MSIKGLYYDKVPFSSQRIYLCCLPSQLAIPIIITELT